jgi:hypothetical protein
MLEERRRTMEWKGFKRGTMGLALVAVILWAGTAFSQPGVVDDDETGQIKEALSIASVPLAISGPLELTMLIDQSYCKTGGVQCTGTGHTAQAALKTNHNPVRVMIQVLDEKRNPVTGLESAAFSIAVPYVPAGGPTLTRVACAECFQGSAGPDGVYAIFVHPAVTGHWKAGAYCLQVEVVVGTAVSNAVGLISIPF